MAKIFISYKRLDKKSVFPIVKKIQAETGLSCWIDLDGIESGDQFEHVIIKAIKECDIVIFMMSKNSILPYIDPNTGEEDPTKQTWTEREVKFALEKGKRVIPVSIDGTKASDCDWLAFNLSGTDSIDINDKDQYNKFLKNISSWCYGNELQERAKDITLQHHSLLPYKKTIIVLAILVAAIISSVLGFFFFNNTKANENEGEDIPECSAQLYLMRYSDLNNIYDNAFDDETLETFCYKDSIGTDDKVYIYPESNYLTLNPANAVQICNWDGQEDTGFPYHLPVLRLKLHSNYSKTIILNKLEIEISNFQKDNNDICRFSIEGGNLVIINEGSTFINGLLNYAELSDGEIASSFDQSKNLKISERAEIPLHGATKKVEGDWNDHYHLLTGTPFIMPKEEKKINISTVEVNDNGIIAVDNSNSTKLGPQNGFTHSLIEGETDDETYISIQVPFSSTMDVRAILTDINEKKIQTPLIHLYCIKPQTGILYPTY